MATTMPGAVYTTAEVLELMDDDAQDFDMESDEDVNEPVMEGSDDDLEPDSFQRERYDHGKYAKMKTNEFRWSTIQLWNPFISISGQFTNFPAFECQVYCTVNRNAHNDNYYYSQLTLPPIIIINNTISSDDESSAEESSPEYSPSEESDVCDRPSSR